MDIVRERLHVGEPRVRVDRAVRLALGAHERLVLLLAGAVLPEVVDVDVVPAVVREAARHHRVRRGAHFRLVHAAAEHVPRVPAHRRGERDRVTHDERHRAPRRALRVRGRDGERIVAARRDCAAHAGGGGVEKGAGGKALHGNLHRTLPAHGDTPEDRASGAHAEARGGVDARRGRDGRCEDAELLGEVPRVRGARAVLEGEKGVRPVRMVARDAVAAVRHLEHHHLHAGEVRLQLRAPAALAEKTGGGGETSVGPDLEFNGRFGATLLVVDAHGRLEGEGVAAHGNDELALGVRTEAVLVGLAVHAEKPAVD